MAQIGSSLHHDMIYWHSSLVFLSIIMAAGAAITVWLSFFKNTTTSVARDNNISSKIAYYFIQQNQNFVIHNLLIVMKKILKKFKFNIYTTCDKLFYFLITISSISIDVFFLIIKFNKKHNALMTIVDEIFTKGQIIKLFN